MVPPGVTPLTSAASPAGFNSVGGSYGQFVTR